ncbi:hypothetical protein [Phytoactinopolyspora alkaliphila]
MYENAYCSSPMCVPSRLFLLSGRPGVYISSLYPRPRTVSR